MSLTIGHKAADRNGSAAFFCLLRFPNGMKIYQIVQIAPRFGLLCRHFDVYAYFL